MTDNVTYLVGFSHEEIREARMALVEFASQYQGFARNHAFDAATRASYIGHADLLLALADRISSTIQRHATLAMAHDVRRRTVIIAE
jgi:hypothetical protein